MDSKYNLIMVKIGYQKFLIDKNAAMKLFDAAVSTEAFCVEDKWLSDEKRSIQLVKPMDQDQLPTLSLFGPERFVAGRAAYEQELQRLRADELAKQKEGVNKV